ncbi:MAG TPA: H-type small acid-soluble spore protein [Desulfotomaculum sp.]|nr:H-type small acid-soluble spore protein [Desulfotomaculum sp.]
MNIDRARQILRSDETITVMLDGSPVWIESVDKSGLARVNSLDGRGKVKSVHVLDLTEA